MLKTGTLAAALIGGTIVAMMAVLPAHGQDATGSRTLAFTTSERSGDEHAIDTPPNGPSVGDRWLLASTLHRGGPGRRTP